ncbi:MAG: HPP family protein, partial [Comamonas sp.]
MAEDSPRPDPFTAERMRLWLRNFLPPPARVDGKELLRIVLGIAVLLVVAGISSRWWGEPHHIPWLFASMGASAMLLISTPSGPMAQPWPVIGGSVLSGISGWAAAQVFQDPNLAAAVAVSLSVMVMMVMRCLHPPGAALAMWIALERVHTLDVMLYPVGLNLVLMVALATVINRMTGKRYPAPQHTQKSAAPRKAGAQLEESDLDVALQRFNGVLDISRADLEMLMQVASQAAFMRTLGNLRCEDIMARPVHAARADTPVHDAWKRMQAHHIKSLPVVDAAHHVVGIVTSTDLLNNALNA